jgi:FAD/FMN-containing dehydrogenase
MATTINTSLGEITIQQFKASLRGQLLQASDNHYNTARKVWNGMINRHPALIVRCLGVADVMNAVSFAREHNLLISIRGGGHNVAGNAVCDGGVMLDMSLMKGVRVDPLKRTVRAQAGLTWGELDHETQTFGLAVTGGQISSTGIAGLTLGGGIGNLMRTCGLTVDNLLSADIVTADGQFLTVSATQNEDLFWGIRGGGGNFGVVTSFEYRLHPVGPIVLGGLALYPAAQATELLRFYRDWAGTAPDELTATAAFLTAPPAPFVPESFHFQPMVGILVCYAGTLDEGQRYINHLRAFATPAVDLIGPMPYVAVQQLLDGAVPWGMQVYLKSTHLTGLPDEAVNVIVRYATTMTSPLSVVPISPLGGAVGRVGEHDTAFGHRDTAFDIQIFGAWTDPQEHDQHVTWVRNFWGDLRPFANGVYVNELGTEGEERVREAYNPQTYKRLVALKNTYDPMNFFRMNQNIKPTA